MEIPPNQSVNDVQRAKDEEHIRLLANFHYAVAAVGALFACIPLIHVAFGIIFMAHPGAFTDGRNPPPPFWFGLLFVVMGSVFVLLGWAMAVCTFISGRFLARHKHRMFSFVAAAILCAFMPFGTVLGIFTIIALSKDSVRRLYEGAD